MNGLRCMVNVIYTRECSALWGEPERERLKSVVGFLQLLKTVLFL